MRATTKVRALGTLAVAGALAMTASPAMAAGQGGMSWTCTGGGIPSGTYSNLSVTGYCTVLPGANINVTGNVQIASGGALNAQLGTSTLTVGRNITAAPGSLAALGCQPPALVGNSAHPCDFDENGHSVVTVGGNVTGSDTVSFLLNGVTVDGNVTFTGGGSNDIPWSIKNNTIGGNLTVTGVTTEWLGVMFNKVGRNVTLTNIQVNDVDPGAPGVYIVRNNVQRNLTCTGLTPGVSGGFVPGSVNVVGGNATGQCAALV